MGLVYILNTIRSFHTIFIRCYLFFFSIYLGVVLFAVMDLLVISMYAFWY